MLVRNFKTGSFISGLAATTLNPDIAYGASRLRRVRNPLSPVILPTAQGSTSGYTSGGGPPLGGVNNTIDKFPFASDANATDVGDLSVRRLGSAGQSSTASGYTSGGYGFPTGSPPGVFTNIIDKFPFATNANATDVGDVTTLMYRQAGQSSTENGYTCGGNAPTGLSNTIDKFPFATNANATDVGDLTSARGGAGQSSTTEGYTSGGYTTTPPFFSVNIIDKFPFASNANASDVGDLTQGRYDLTGQNSDTSGYVSGGGRGALERVVNTIDKFPFASNANATDVGDLTQTRNSPAGQSSTASGYTSGGQFTAPPAPPTPPLNTIDKFPFASDANATDVGDLSLSRYKSAGQQV